MVAAKPVAKKSNKVGRKKMLVTSLLLMGLATFAIGLLPTYAAIGAPAAMATAVAAYVSATDTAGDGFLTAYECGTPRPNASAANYRAGQTRGVADEDPGEDAGAMPPVGGVDRRIGPRGGGRGGHGHAVAIIRDRSMRPVSFRLYLTRSASSFSM